MINPSSLLIILMSSLISFIFSKLIIAITTKIKFINKPNPIVESHRIPVAYGGGLAIALTLLSTVLIYDLNYKPIGFFLIIIFSAVVIGLLDDIFRLSPMIKLISQLIVSIPILSAFTTYSVFFLGVSLFLIVFSQNAWNLVDVMDGLTSSISFIIFITVGIILSDQIELKFYSMVSFITSFSVLGFWLVNKYPAKMFLGEAGTMLLGSLFAYIVVSTYSTDKIIALYLVLLGIVPFFELIFLLIVRTQKGIPFYKGSPDHFALRMLNNGFTIQSINFKVLLLNIIHSAIILVAITFLKDFYFLLLFAIIDLVAGVFAFYYFHSLPSRDMSKRN